MPSKERKTPLMFIDQGMGTGLKLYEDEESDLIYVNPSWCGTEHSVKLNLEEVSRLQIVLTFWLHQRVRCGCKYCIEESRKRTATSQRR